MDRAEELRRYVTREARGIEIGPYFTPLTPRRGGFHSVHLDVFDEEELRRRAAADPALKKSDEKRIEPVDLVGSAVDIATLVQGKYGNEQFGYVISSHNFEHLPDPIAFLQGCQSVLKPDGVLSMAVPDYRYCFDFYRARSETGALLEAFAERRRRPSATQVFQWASTVSEVRGSGAWHAGETELPVPTGDLAGAFALWTAMNADPDMPYTDAHCWTFTPASFRLIIEDLRFLGLHTFEVVAVSPTYGSEFFVHLRNTSHMDEAADNYRERRVQLLRDAVVESSMTGSQLASAGPQQPLENRLHRVRRRLASRFR